VSGQGVSKQRIAKEATKRTRESKERGDVKTTPCGRDLMSGWRSAVDLHSKLTHLKQVFVSKIDPRVNPSSR